jgi:hypothetical protein
MKALKSDRAKDLLADSNARDELRTYLAGLHKVGGLTAGTQIKVRSRDGKTVALTPIPVRKAA